MDGSESDLGFRAEGFYRRFGFRIWGIEVRKYGNRNRRRSACRRRNTEVSDFQCGIKEHRLVMSSRPATSTRPWKSSTRVPLQIMLQRDIASYKDEHDALL